MEIFFYLLSIAQLIIDLSPLEKFFSAQLIVQCAKFFFRFLNVGLVFFFFFLKFVKRSVSKKDVLISSITILLKDL